MAYNLDNVDPFGAPPTGGCRLRHESPVRRKSPKINEVVTGGSRLRQSPPQGAAVRNPPVGQSIPNTPPPRTVNQQVGAPVCPKTAANEARPKRECKFERRAIERRESFGDNARTRTHRRSLPDQFAASDIDAPELMGVKQTYGGDEDLIIERPLHERRLQRFKNIQCKRQQLIKQQEEQEAQKQLEEQKKTMWPPPLPLIFQKKIPPPKISPVVIQNLMDMDVEPDNLMELSPPLQPHDRFFPSPKKSRRKVPRRRNRGDDTYGDSYDDKEDQRCQRNRRYRRNREYSEDDDYEDNRRYQGDKRYQRNRRRRRYEESPEDDEYDDYEGYERDQRYYGNRRRRRYEEYSEDDEDEDYESDRGYQRNKRYQRDQECQGNRRYQEDRPYRKNRRYRDNQGNRRYRDNQGNRRYKRNREYELEEDEYGNYEPQCTSTPLKPSRKSRYTSPYIPQDQIQPSLERMPVSDPRRSPIVFTEFLQPQEPLIMKEPTGFAQKLPSLYNRPNNEMVDYLLGGIYQEPTQQTYTPVPQPGCDLLAFSPTKSSPRTCTPQKSICAQSPTRARVSPPRASTPPKPICEQIDPCVQSDPCAQGSPTRDSLPLQSPCEPRTISSVAYTSPKRSPIASRSQTPLEPHEEEIVVPSTPTRPFADLAREGFQRMFPQKHLPKFARTSPKRIRVVKLAKPASPSKLPFSLTGSPQICPRTYRVSRFRRDLAEPWQREEQKVEEICPPPEEEEICPPQEEVVPCEPRPPIPAFDRLTLEGFKILYPEKELPAFASQHIPETTVAPRARTNIFDERPEHIPPYIPPPVHLHAVPDTMIPSQIPDRKVIPIAEYIPAHTIPLSSLRPEAAPALENLPAFRTVAEPQTVRSPCSPGRSKNIPDPTRSPIFSPNRGRAPYSKQELDMEGARIERELEEENARCDERQRRNRERQKDKIKNIEKLKCELNKIPPLQKVSNMAEVQRMMDECEPTERQQGPATKELETYETRMKNVLSLLKPMLEEERERLRRQQLQPLTPPQYQTPEMQRLCVSRGRQRTPTSFGIRDLSIRTPLGDISVTPNFAVNLDLGVTAAIDDSPNSTPQPLCLEY